MIKKSITIFTPTFNRGYCLHQVYESLLRQTSKDFHWLIVDDGSSDNTAEIVQSWIIAQKLDITYVKQENMGMVAAHNTAHNHINTELNVCIDSDDYMPDNGVEKILFLWRENSKPNHMGLVGLDSYKDGRIIGVPFPENVTQCKFSEISSKYKVTGDKKYVLRTDLIKKHLPYPYFKGEKFPAPSYLYLMIEQDYEFLLFNEVFCVVEYLPDGNSMNKFNQYIKSPNAFASYRIAKMKYALNYRERFRNAIHFVSSSLFADKINFFKKSPYKMTTLLAAPFGYGLYLYIKHSKTRAANRTLNKK